MSGFPEEHRALTRRQPPRSLRLCYGGDRYSEDLDFVCGKAGSYFTDVEFKELIEAALETTKKTLNRDFGIAPDQVSLKKPPDPDLVKQAPIPLRPERSEHLLSY